MNKRVTEKDKKDWEDFLSQKDKLPNKDINPTDKRVPKVITVDLHGYTLDEANIKIDDLINKSYEEQVSKLIIVTGKGLHSQNDKDPYVSKKLGILRYSVPEFIKNNIELMKKILEIKNADIEDGGSGAFYIYLKKKL